MPRFRFIENREGEVSVVNPSSSEAQIARVVAEFSAAAFPHGLRSIVLTGSVARGEGTWVHDGARAVLRGDAEFLLVFDDGGALPVRERVDRLMAAVEARLSGFAIDAHIGLSPVGLEFLRALRPCIFTYELVTNGRVICGDPEILEIAPKFSPAAIPLEDAFRLLLNRVVELLEVLCVTDPGGSTVDEAMYRSVKLTLDMATSFLVFRGHYEPSYRARAARLCALAVGSVPVPIDLMRFAERVARATRIKLGETDESGVDADIDLSRLINEAHSVWRWELERLTSGAPSVSDEELIRRWFSAQPVSERIRGWASLARRVGFGFVLKHGARWLTEASRGSPRYLVYAAASELFFAIPGLLGSEGHNAVRAERWNQLRIGLPLGAASARPPDVDAWRVLGSTIASHYHRFLEFTRS